jgi:hypothetical protein
MHADIYTGAQQQCADAYTGAQQELGYSYMPRGARLRILRDLLTLVYLSTAGARLRLRLRLHAATHSCNRRTAAPAASPSPQAPPPRVSVFVLSYYESK